MYDRTSNPFWQLEDFLKKVSEAYDKRNRTDDSRKFEVMITSLSPKADTEILPGSAPNLPGLPDEIDDEGK